LNFLLRTGRGILVRDDLFDGLKKYLPGNPVPRTEFDQWFDANSSQKDGLSLAEFMASLNEIKSTGSPQSKAFNEVTEFELCKMYVRKFRIILFMGLQFLLECKDEHGREKTIRVSSSKPFRFLSEQLLVEFDRPVTFVYEHGQTMQTVEDEHSYRECVEYVKTKSSRAVAGPAEKLPVLEAYIVVNQQVPWQSGKFRMKKSDLNEKTSPVKPATASRQGDSDPMQSDSKIRHLEDDPAPRRLAGCAVLLILLISQ
jgi:hypothetical protein